MKIDDLLPKEEKVISDATWLLLQSYGIDHLSATQINMFRRCEEQYRQRYIHGRVEPPGGALILGGAFHVGMEHNFRQKISSQVDLPTNEVVDAYHHGFDRKVEEAGGSSEIAWKESENQDTVRKVGAVCTQVYQRDVAPRMFPSDVEHKFSKAVDGALLPVTGSIDFMGKFGSPESDGVLVDFKTSAKAKRELSPEWQTQGQIYQLEVPAPVQWQVAVKSKGGQIITPQDEPGLLQEVTGSSLRHAERLVREIPTTIAYYLQRYGPDEVWPSARGRGTMPNPHPCNWCGYRPTCPSWEGE